MKSTSLLTLTLAGFFASAAPSMAQVVSTNAVMYTSQQTLTTGMVGLTTNQTARLTVLNLNSTTTTAPTTATNCTVQLQFFDAQNNAVKQSIVPNFAPLTATTLDLPRTEITAQTGLRAEVRGMITVNPSNTPNATVANPGPCSVFPSLQIIDNTTGSTVVLTTDARALFSMLIVPLSLR